MVDKYKVYKHVNKIDGKQYIGITKQKPEERWGNNGKRYKKSCPYFWNAIVKYGWDNFDHIIVADNLSKEEACSMEIQLISLNKTQDNNFGYNILEGGTAPAMPQEVRDKMSLAAKGNKKCLGRTYTEEQRKRMSEAQKGRPLTEEHKQKLCKPKSVTYPCSEEKRQHIIDAKKDKKTIVCIETNIIYPSIHECARQMNISATSICAVLHGRHKSTHGYHFQYYT